MSFNDYVPQQEDESQKLIIDQATGEVINDEAVVDFRKASVM